MVIEDFLESKNIRLDQQLRFTAEIDKMTAILRRTMLIDGSRRENDAEHSWHIAVMALIFAEYTVEPVDIARAVKIQRKRQGTRNARLSPQEIQDYCSMEKDVRDVLDKAIVRYGFSPRSISSCIKVARTIADIAGSEKIAQPHIAEAISFHKLCANMRLEL